MVAAVENISYRYRAPLRYVFFFVGFLCAGAIASLFFAAVRPWVFRAVILFIMVVAFGGGLAFLVGFLRNLSGQIVFGQDFVMLPGRGKRRVVLAYSDISKVEEMKTYGRLLKISTPGGADYVLYEGWMSRGEFDVVAEVFRTKTEAARR